MADSGAAVVAWLEPGEQFAVKAVRRPAGGAFGPAETLGTARSSSEYSFDGAVRAAIAADGEAFVLWTQPPADRDTLRMPVNVAIAPAAGAFAPAQRLGETHPTSPPALAAGRDGRALAAFWTGRQVQVAERAPGSAFAASMAAASVKEPFTVLPAAAIGPGGAAAVAWYGLFSQSVGAIARSGAGAFGAPVTLAAPSRVPGLTDDVLLLLTAFGLTATAPGGEGLDGEIADPRIALTPDGRALVNWLNALAVPRAAAFPLSGGHLDRFALGSGVREASSVTPLITASGAPAVAWGDNDPAKRDGRVHLAVAGVSPAPDASAPRVSLGRPRKTVLAQADTLQLPVTCSAACEVRVDVPDAFAATAYTALPGAGTRVVGIQSFLTPIAPARRGPVRVRVRYSAPGARTASERIETVTLERSATAAPPKVEGLRAVRHGSRVDVSWRTDRDADPDAFVVAGTVGRAFELERLVDAEAKRAGKRRFTARLTGAKEVRYVFVFVGGESGTITGPYVARVR